jgi:class 3 adenylate cyclase
MSNKFEQLLEFSKRRNGRHIAGLELGAGFAVGSVVVGGGRRCGRARSCVARVETVEECHRDHVGL